MRIEDYSFGRIVIEGKTYTSDVIIFPERVFSPWWRKEGHLLRMEDLADVLKERPEVLIIGSGRSGVMTVPEDLIKELEKSGITTVVARTAEAVTLFNARMEKRVIAALHLTC